MPMTFMSTIEEVGGTQDLPEGREATQLEMFEIYLRVSQAAV